MLAAILESPNVTSDYEASKNIEQAGDQVKEVLHLAAQSMPRRINSLGISASKTFLWCPSAL